MRTQHPKYKLIMAPTSSFDTGMQQQIGMPKSSCTLVNIYLSWVDFEEKVITPDSPTIETKAAMKIVGEIWTTVASTEFDEDNMEVDDRPRRPLAKTASDENGNAKPLLGEMGTPTRRPLSIVSSTEGLGLGRSPLGERLFGSPSKRRHLDTKP
jgi:hypothetical protein